MVDPKLARAYGTLAGFAFIGVALLGVPGALLLEPQPDREAFFLTLAAALTGIVCMALRWDMFDPRWLHALGFLATAEAAASVAIFGFPYVAIYFLIAVFAAYLAPDGRTLAIHLGLICVALFGPIAYGPEDARSSLSVALITIPVLLLTAGLFAYLRQKMVHDRRAYHRFAEQTLVLSSQIAGRPLGPPRLVHDSVPALPFISRVRPPRALLAGIAAIVALPLFAGGLAVAGVKLPGLAADPFERLGIELPNQEDAAEGTAPAAAEPAGKPSDGAASEAAAAQTAPGEGAGAARRRVPPEPAPDAPSAGSASVATEPPAEPGLVPAEPHAAGGETPAEPEPATNPTEQPATPVKDVLEQAGNGLQDLLDGQR